MIKYLFVYKKKSCQKKHEYVGIITHVIIKWHNVKKHDFNEG